MRYLSDKRGFTLLELVAVLFIIATAAALVAVSVGKSIDKATLREEAVRLRNTLRHARELALIERIPAFVKLDESKNLYWIEINNAPKGAPHVLPKGLFLRTAGEVVFLPKGQSTGGEVVLEDERRKGYIVQVDPVTGAPTIKRI